MVKTLTYLRQKIKINRKTKKRKKKKNSSSGVGGRLLKEKKRGTQGARRGFCGILF
jgi:hypothetical protein